MNHSTDKKPSNTVLLLRIFGPDDALFSPVEAAMINARRASNASTQAKIPRAPQISGRNYFVYRDALSTTISQPTHSPRCYPIRRFL